MPDFTWGVPSGMQAVSPSGLTIVRNADLTAVQQVAAGATGTKTATSSLTAAPRGYLAMTMGLAVSGSGTVNPDPNPGNPTPADTYRSIRFVNGGSSSGWFAVSAVNPDATSNPAGADYPGYRGPNQLVIYTNPPTSTTATNQYGVEVQVGSDNVVDAVNDRLVSGSTSGTSVPSGGYVISAHDTARQFVLGALATSPTSWTVELSYELPPGVDPTPNPTPTPTGAYPPNVVSVYKMIWDVNGPNLSSIGAGANEIRLAFAQGSPPALVGYGAEGATSLKAAIAARSAAGGRISISVGGSGGALQIGNRSAFLSGIQAIRDDFSGNLHGLDWDQEIATSFNDADVVWLSEQLKSRFGQGFGITFATTVVNGTPYTLNAAVLCSRAGVLDFYAQQFYDAPVSLAAAKGRITEALGRGIPESQLGVGMMIGSTSNYWTNAQCRTYYTDIRNTWPGIRKAFLWEASRAGTSEWISDMQRING